MFVVCGFPGSGKSTVSGALTKLTGIACLRKDDLKVVLAKNGVSAARPMAVFYDLASSMVREGGSVILDACFNFDEDVELLGDLVGVVAGPTVVLECVAPSEERISRIRRRVRHPAHSAADQLSIEQAGRVAFDYRRLPGTLRFPIDTACPPAATREQLLEVLKAVPTGRGLCRAQPRERV